jgi:hypothetical protein
VISQRKPRWQRWGGSNDYEAERRADHRRALFPRRGEPLPRFLWRVLAFWLVVLAGALVVGMLR